MSAASYSQIACAVIRHFREIKDIDQKRLAELLGVPRSTWSKVERGDSPLTLDMLAELAKLWGVPPASVFTYVDYVVAGLKDAGWDVLTAGGTSSHLAPMDAVYASSKDFAADVLRRVPGIFDF